jgi:hypothetical protein
MTFDWADPTCILEPEILVCDGSFPTLWQYMDQIWAVILCSRAIWGTFLRFPTEVLVRTAPVGEPFGHATGPDLCGRAPSVPIQAMLAGGRAGEDRLRTLCGNRELARYRVRVGLRQAAAPVIRANHVYCAPSEPSTSAPFPSEEAPPRHPPPETFASALCDVCTANIGPLGGHVNRTP